MVDVPEYFCMYLNSQRKCNPKARLNWVKPSLDQDQSKDRKRLKKTAVLVFFGPGPVFFGFRKRLDWSWSESCFFGPKNQTGPDFQALHSLICHCQQQSLSCLSFFSLLSSFIYISYHIGKCAQTM